MAFPSLLFGFSGLTEFLTPNFELSEAPAQDVPYRLITWFALGFTAGMFATAILEPEQLRRGKAGGMVVSTSHPNVPRDLFSQRLQEMPNCWSIAKPGQPAPLAAIVNGKYVFANQNAKDWLTGCADKLSHGLTSALLYVTYGKGKEPDTGVRRAVFSAFLQSLLADLHDGIIARGRTADEAHAMVDCISTVMLEESLEQLDHYPQLARMDAEKRKAHVATLCRVMLRGKSKLEEDLRSAYVLLHLITVFYLADLARS